MRSRPNPAPASISPGQEAWRAVGVDELGGDRDLERGSLSVRRGARGGSLWLIGRKSARRKAYSTVRLARFDALDGVGSATARTLCGYGLDSVGRVAAAPLAVLQRLVGAKAGRELWERARGVDRVVVVPNAVSLSTAAARSFPYDEVDRSEQRRALLSLAGELGARLRTEGQVCRSLAITVRYADRTTTTRIRTLPEPAAHSASLTSLAYALHDALGFQRARVRGIALRAEGLAGAEGAAYQLSLDPAGEKARLIEAVADRARAKFGPKAVLPGSLAA
ncbi:hypothetical protein [Streptomyces sp. NBC_00094]|uniref:DinB/UmuC family translesion DNA polymerase n=1 Tax=Streptomyces sp. NBC_00094 TaxID=2903620 RepID=UPI00225644D1|nr:hypothetical protein [Streptomyces sp. NBC_00094]MCX5389792.1 hypothetical protein [Streptomyces sp. NBC_00094]